VFRSLLAAITATTICIAVTACEDAASSQGDTQATPVGSVANCFSDDADLKISGCTALIESGRETQLNLASAFYNRGSAYLTKRDYERAIQDYDKAIRLRSDYYAPFQGRCAARAYADKGFAEALSDCDESLRLNPGNVDSLGLRGLVNFKMGRYDKAIADCDQVLSQYPQSPFGLYLRGLAKRMSHDIAGGNADIAAAKAIRPNEPEQFAAYGVRP
jgi:tetratricopeptide (TPR) repeat protein